jgi:ubiquinone/menaquinone biosynthesis C-methylase UbiE
MVGSGFPTSGMMAEAETIMSIFNQMSLPELYEQFLVQPLFRPFAEQLLNRLEPTPTDSLLDVACGTGIVARLARERLGADVRIVGVDASPAMVAIARRVESTIDWREGNAMALPIHAAERFSLVSCHQGLQFFPDKLTAVREMRRALLPGGRVALASWLSLPDMPFAADMHYVAERLFGPIVDARHSFGDAHAFQPLLTEAGFSDIHVEQISQVVRGIDGPTYARLNAMAAVGMSPKGKTYSDAERAEWIERLVADSLPVVAKYTKDGVFEVALATNLATARA